MDFAAALPRLVAAYDAGILVPFLGAGMSVPAVPGWLDFVEGLERAAGIQLPPHAPTRRGADAARPAATDLVRRANRAVRVLKRREPDNFPAAVRSALYPPLSGNASHTAVPRQTRTLATMWWPLVLTTNYDDVYATAYVAAYPKPRDQLTVFGRSPQDCQSILSSLSAPTGCVLWALQGYLPRAATTADSGAALDTELIVGHEEYRRVTHAAPHFRRAFADVYRRRSLLFVGSGLAEPYFAELFGETLETYGANPVPHYAMVKTGTVDTDFWRSRFNTTVLEYADHDVLPDWIEQLYTAWQAARPRQSRWGYSLNLGLDMTELKEDDLELVRGALPLPSKNECAAVSAGRKPTGGLRLSKNVKAYLDRAHAQQLISDARRAPIVLSSHLQVFEATSGGVAAPIAAVIARGEGDSKDLRVIQESVYTALDWAAERRCDRLRMQMLASGRTAHFLARYSLTETVQAFVRWRSEARPIPVRLSLYVTDGGVLFELATGRIDVGELLTCRDVRFWVEVTEAGRVLDRSIVFLPDTVTAGDVASQFDIPRDGWDVEVIPPPQRKTRKHPLATVDAKDIRDLGVLAGSTLRFRARPRA